MTLTDNRQFGRREHRFWEGLNSLDTVLENRRQQDKLQYDMGKARIIAKYNELCHR